MKTVSVNLKERSYKILIADKIIKRAGEVIKRLGIGNDAFIITNTLIRNKHGNALKESLKQSGISVKFKVVKDTEKSKSIESVIKINQELVDYDRGKKIFIVAFGGGVVGDLAGFVSSIYKRGVNYIQVPTTLLAQIDSGIGGKTAIDLAEAKNLVGTFYQPRLVLSDISLLETLKPRQIRSGLAEAIKYGIIEDRVLFSFIEKNYKELLSCNREKLGFLVYRSSSIKARIVECDENEQKGLRTILNFGHTIGHAIEAAGHYQGYTHGEAIALGMLVASRISLGLGLTGKDVFERIRNVIALVGLPLKIRKISPAKIIVAHYRDKKFKGRINRFVLVRDIGSVVVKENVPIGLIKEALKENINS